MRALVLCLAACSSAPSPVPPTATAELSPALASLGWWLGDWQAEDGGAGSEHWVAADGAIYGIALQDARFEVMIVDDGEARGKPDGVLRFLAMPGGARAVEFRHARSEPHSITFANPAHDDPKAITYTREGHQLRALVGNDHFSFKRTFAARAPELEAADTAFANDTAARGIDGWVAAFDPAGAMMSPAGRVEGADAIRVFMGGVLAKYRVEWAPIASARRGDLGYTVGKATFTAPGDRWRSTYVTIWKLQPDGTWKVLFDTGRPIHE